MRRELSATARCTIRRSYGLSGPQLLIDAGLLRSSRRGISPSAAARRPCPCDTQGVARTAVVSSGSVAAVRHVDDVLQRLEWFAAMTHEDLRVAAVDVDAWAVRGVLDRRWSWTTPSAAVKRCRNSMIGCVASFVIVEPSGVTKNSSREAASVLPAPTRFTRRSAAGPPPPVMTGGPMMIVRRVLPGR